jgi:hypothetical protein
LADSLKTGSPGGLSIPSGAVRGRRPTLCRYLIESLPPPNAVGQVASSAESAIEAYRSLYMRAMSDLTSRAVQLEADLGLPALDADSAASPTSLAGRMPDRTDHDDRLKFHHSSFL